MQLRIISEAGYGRTYSFDYGHAKTDPRPRILLLGKYRHPSTRNILLGGINLNYLSDEQLGRIRKNLKAILQPRNLQGRYWKGVELVPDVFENYYRNYDKDYIGAITKDTLKFWPSDAALQAAEKQAQDDAAKQKEAELKKAPAAPVPGAPPTMPAATPGAPAPVEPAVPPGAPAPEPAVAKPEAPPPKEPAAKPAPAKAPEAKPKPTARQRRLVPKPAPKPAVPEPAAPAPTPAAAPTAEPTKPTEPAGLAPETPAPAEPAPVEPKPKLTSAQKRKKQAQQIEKAIQRTQPQPKPEPPPEIGGAVNLFKPKK